MALPIAGRQQRITPPPALMNYCSLFLGHGVWRVAHPAGGYCAAPDPGGGTGCEHLVHAGRDVLPAGGVLRVALAIAHDGAATGSVITSARRRLEQDRYPHGRIRAPIPGCRMVVNRAREPRKDAPEVRPGSTQPRDSTLAKTAREVRNLSHKHHHRVIEPRYLAHVIRQGATYDVGLSDPSR